MVICLEFDLLNMSPKRARASASSSYDSTRFISVDAEKRYNEEVVYKTPVLERGYDVSESWFPNVNLIILSKQ